MEMQEEEEEMEEACGAVGGQGAAQRAGCWRRKGKMRLELRPTLKLTSEAKKRDGV